MKEMTDHQQSRNQQALDAKSIAGILLREIKALRETLATLKAENEMLREALKDAEVTQGELLAALKGMEKWASSIHDGYPPSTASIAAAPYREAARAAIAKATGGEQ